MSWSISVHHAEDDHFYIEGPIDLRVDYEDEDPKAREETYAWARRLVETLNAHLDGSGATE